MNVVRFEQAVRSVTSSFAIRPRMSSVADGQMIFASRCTGPVLRRSVR